MNTNEPDQDPDANRPPSLWRKLIEWGPTATDARYYLSGPGIDGVLISPVPFKKPGVLLLLNELESQKPDYDKIRAALSNLPGSLLEQARQCVRDGSPRQARYAFSLYDPWLGLMSDETWEALVRILNPVGQATTAPKPSPRRPGRPSKERDEIKRYYCEHEKEFLPLLGNTDGRRQVADQISNALFNTGSSQKPDDRVTRFLRELHRPKGRNRKRRAPHP